MKKIWLQLQYISDILSTLSGGTGSAGTGPSGAATGSYYAYFESSSPVLAGDKAWTKIKKLGGGNRVLEFDFHAYGAE